MDSVEASNPPPLSGLKRRLKRIEPVQAGKVLGILYALFSLLFFPFFALFFALAAVIPAAAGAPQTQDMPPVAVLGGMGLFFMLLAPIIYGVMGFVVGAVGALLYNLVAKWVGGIVVEIE